MRLSFTSGNIDIDWININSQSLNEKSNSTDIMLNFNEDKFYDLALSKTRKFGTVIFDGKGPDYIVCPVECGNNTVDVSFKYFKSMCSENHVFFSDESVRVSKKIFLGNKLLQT